MRPATGSNVNEKLVGTPGLDPVAAATHCQLTHLRREWSRWGASLTNWSHFATLTSTTAVGEEAAIAGAKRWVRRLEGRVQGPVDHFIAVERGGGGLLHSHVLVAGTEHLTAETLKQSWMEGRSDVQPYDSSRGAWSYVTKGIGADVVDYDLRVRRVRKDS